MEKKVLLKDIADYLGVSTALVSYVLNGKDRVARVSPKTAKRIREAAKEMNYRPNLIAQSLKSGKSNAIGLIVADISNPFFGQLARTIEDESKRLGYTVIFGSSDEDAHKSGRLIEALINRSMDGFIIVPSEGTEQQLKSLNDRGIPYILIDRYFKEIDSNYVIIDNEAATYEATKKLIEKGRSRIAYVRYRSKLLHTELRFAGYKKALEEAKIPFRNNLICKIDFKNQDIFLAEFGKLFKGKNAADAVVFSTNTLSILGLKALNILNKKVPEEVDVFCFDQSEAYDLFYHPVSYVNQPLEEIGKKAVEILVNQIKSDTAPLQKVVLRANLVETSPLDIKS